jgi:hypothetical protein
MALAAALVHTGSWCTLVLACSRLHQHAVGGLQVVCLYRLFIQGCIIMAHDASRCITSQPLCCAVCYKLKLAQLGGRCIRLMNRSIKCCCTTQELLPAMHSVLYDSGFGQSQAAWYGVVIARLSLHVFLLPGGAESYWLATHDSVT